MSDAFQTLMANVSAHVEVFEPNAPYGPWMEPDDLGHADCSLCEMARRHAAEEVEAK